MILRKATASLLFTLAIASLHTQAHDTISVKDATATYLGNEGVMIKDGNRQVLFDPFFHNSYGQYQLVPKDIRDAIFAAKPPYDNVKAVFISHAHGDHFDADDVVRYLKTHDNIHLVAPRQALEQLQGKADYQSIKARLVAADPSDDAQVWTHKLGDILIEAVIIPHSGWPGRADITNLVYRVTLSDQATVIHMGDADVNDRHFAPLKAHWLKRQTHTAFPPYWFFARPAGRQILNERINTLESIGVHVPGRAVPQLKQAGIPIFSEPGEQTLLGHKH